MQHTHIEKFSDGTLLMETGGDILELDWEQIIGLNNMFNELIIAGKDSEMDIYVNGKGEVIEKKMHIVE